MPIETGLVTFQTLYLAATIILWAVGKNIFGISGLAVDLSGVGNVLRWLTLCLFVVTVALLGWWSTRGGAAKANKIGKALISLVLLLAAFAVVTRL